MKGFLVRALLLADRAAQESLATPVHFAFSHDEEIGCVGVRSMIDGPETRAVQPRFAIVGEPTSMRVATAGWAGKIAARRPVVASQDILIAGPRALNAIHLACDLIDSIRKQQSRIERDGFRDDDYVAPYTTLHVGRIDGGTALNIVPDRCTVDFEIRNIARDDAGAMLDRLMNEAATIAGHHRDAFPQAHIGVEVFNDYPGLATPADAEVVRFLLAGLSHPKRTRRLISEPRGASSGNASACQLSYADRDQWTYGHKPDEFIALDLLEACERMMERLLQCCSGKQLRGKVLAAIC